jgi:hypothetical protein
MEELRVVAERELIQQVLVIGALVETVAEAEAEAEELVIQ